MNGNDSMSHDDQFVQPQSVSDTSGSDQDSETSDRDDRSIRQDLMIDGSARTLLDEFRDRRLRGGEQERNETVVKDNAGNVVLRLDERGEQGMYGIGQVMTGSLDVEEGSSQATAMLSQNKIVVRGLGEKVYSYSLRGRIWSGKEEGELYSCGICAAAVLGCDLEEHSEYHWRWTK